MHKSKIYHRSFNNGNIEDVYGEDYIFRLSTHFCIYMRSHNSMRIIRRLEGSSFTFCFCCHRYIKQGILYDYWVTDYLVIPLSISLIDVI
jgi:hypothetical protein